MFEVVYTETVPFEDMRTVYTCSEECAHVYIQSVNGSKQSIIEIESTEQAGICEECQRDLVNPRQS